MAISKIEKLLLLDVGDIFLRPFPFLKNWYKNLHKNISQMYVDYDPWEHEGDDYDDNKLSKLGLDVKSINDKRMYWEYNTRGDRITLDDEYTNTWRS